MIRFVSRPSATEFSNIINLYCDAFNAPDKGEAWGAEAAREYFLSQSDEPFYALKYHGDDVIGFVFGHPVADDPRVFYLSQFVVMGGFQGQGIGTDMLQALIKECAARFDIMRVRCRAENAPMVALLGAFDFEERDRMVSEFGGVSCERIVFEKEITSAVVS